MFSPIAKRAPKRGSLSFYTGCTRDKFATDLLSMAIDFITEIDSMVWSSSLPDLIEFATDESVVKIEIYQGSSSFPIYTTLLYANNGKVSLSSVKELVEFRLLQNNWLFDEFTIYCKNSTGTYGKSRHIFVFYSKMLMPLSVENFTQKFFMSLAPYIRVSQNGFLMSSLFIGETLPATTLRMKVFYDDNLIANCSLDTQEYIFIKNNFIIVLISTFISETSIKNKLSSLGIVAHKIKAVNIWQENGSSLMAYFVGGREELTLTYRNNFNVFETLSVPGITTEKTKKESSVGVLEYKQVLYDCVVEKEFEFESAELPNDYLRHMDEVLNSYEVRLGSSSNPETLPEIIITANTSQISSSDDATNKIKFTWKYSNLRPMANIPADAEIFSPPFTPEFS